MSKTVREIIDYADRIKPNAFSDEDKVMWMNEIEGRIMREIFLMSEADRYEFTKDRVYADENPDRVLVEVPYDNIYGLYLAAQIDYANGEYNKYNNTMQAFNAAMIAFTKYFADTYAPADGYYTDIPLSLRKV